ncbi:MAG: hypothetical protein DRG78_14370 [Epsilonproteobacteria bacterium]|nr:MAG: hypothetical protein DRG78_14370 [Campylobacterota bacterium]
MEQKNYTNKFSFIQQSLDGGEYDVVIKESATLFEVAMKQIFHQAITKLPFADRKELQKAEEEIGKGNKGVDDFTFGQLVGLYRQSKLFKKWESYSNVDLGILTSLDLNSIVEMRNKLTHQGATCSKFEAELVFNYLKNFFASLGLADIEEAVEKVFDSKLTQQKVADNSNKDNTQKKIFNYLENRGLIINPSDESRNISFKVESINFIFETIVKELTNGNHDISSVFYKSGFASGEKFGAIMNEKWELQKDDISLEDKISLWCQFDSDVGWGKLSNNINIDYENFDISGHIELNENFQSYKRVSKNLEDCELMKGYISGVLEQLLSGLETKIECDMGKCPRENPFHKKCIFNISKEVN